MIDGRTDAHKLQSDWERARSSLAFVELGKGHSESGGLRLTVLSCCTDCSRHARWTHQREQIRVHNVASRSSQQGRSVDELSARPPRIPQLANAPRWHEK